MKIICDYSESIKNLELLSRIDCNKRESYKQIRSLLNRTILPINILTLKTGMSLFRARKNPINQDFHSQNEISYCKCKFKINNHGRANEPRQALFYASHKVETALFETSSLFPQKSVKMGTEIFTIGKWIVHQNIDLIAILSDKNAMTCDPEINRIYCDSRKIPIDPIAEQILEFFSKEFSKDCCGNANLYKISCALFNHLIQVTPNKFFGVVYPSVENEYRDLNVALLPKTVDQSLTLDSVIEYQIDTRIGSIFPIRYADKVVNNKFILKDIKETPTLP